MRSVKSTLWRLGLVVALAAGAPLVRAGGDLTQQVPVSIRVALGDAHDALRFFPANLSLETGKLYQLVLVNPSPQKHYFSSDALSRSVFTRKVQVNGPDGSATAEIKGHIREIEVYPGGTAEWWFVPIKAAQITDLVCTIPGHGAAGMVGSISIK